MAAAFGQAFAQEIPYTIGTTISPHSKGFTLQLGGEGIDAKEPSRFTHESFEFFSDSTDLKSAYAYPISEFGGIVLSEPTFTVDTVDVIILVSTNNLPVHTIQGKWIKYRWSTNWIVDWWSKPEDQILDINFQSLDPSYYVWDYKTKK